jgi:AcrR family transcriptional regulator
MARPRTIDREKLLDAAEELVREKGAAGLTIDALARACGVTKGGVQYCFGTKDELIAAMFARWDRGYDRRFAELAGPSPGPVRRVRAHAAAMHGSDEVSMAKAASMMAALLQTPEHLASTRAWYAERLADLDATTAEGRRARLAFLACEGAFMLRFLRFMEIDAAEWDAIFADIAALLDARGSPGEDGAGA